MPILSIRKNVTQAQLESVAEINMRKKNASKPPIQKPIIRLSQTKSVVSIKKKGKTNENYRIDDLIY